MKLYAKYAYMKKLTNLWKTFTENDISISQSGMKIDINFRMTSKIFVINILKKISIENGH